MSYIRDTFLSYGHDSTVIDMNITMSESMKRNLNFAVITIKTIDITRKMRYTNRNRRSFL